MSAFPGHAGRVGRSSAGAPSLASDSTGAAMTGDRGTSMSARPRRAGDARGAAAVPAAVAVRPRTRARRRRPRRRRLRHAQARLRGAARPWSAAPSRTARRSSRRTAGRRVRAARRRSSPASSCFALLCGFFVARAAGRRDPGNTITGDISQTARERNTQCLNEARDDPSKAVACYTSVLADAPQNVEALTYRGWVRFVSGDAKGIVDLQQAVKLDGNYPDVHAFLAIVLFRAGLRHRRAGRTAAARRVEPVTADRTTSCGVAGAGASKRWRIPRRSPCTPARRRRHRHRRAEDDPARRRPGLLRRRPRTGRRRARRRRRLSRLRSPGRAHAGHPPEGPAARRSARLHARPARLRERGVAVRARRTHEADHQRRRHQPDCCGPGRGRDHQGARRFRCHRRHGRRRRRPAACRGPRSS